MYIVARPSRTWGLLHVENDVGDVSRRCAWRDGDEREAVSGAEGSRVDGLGPIEYVIHAHRGLASGVPEVHQRKEAVVLGRDYVAAPPGESVRGNRLDLKGRMYGVLEKRHSLEDSFRSDPLTSKKRVYRHAAPWRPTEGGVQAPMNSAHYGTNLVYRRSD